MASLPLNSSVVAREALRRLAATRLPPTPENYTRLYYEIASPATQLESLPSIGLAREFASTIQTKDELLWASLIRELLENWERRVPGFPLGRKREGLEHVLTAYATNPDLLHARLFGLVRAWKDSGTDHSVRVFDGVDTPDEASARASPRAQAASAPEAGLDPELGAFVRELLASTLTFSVVERPGHPLELAEEARALAVQTREAETGQAVSELGVRLKEFWYALELRGDEQYEIQRGLLRLLSALCGNVGELVGDGAWLRGQLKMIEALTAGPIDRASLDALEKGLREVMYKQSLLKESLDHAKDALKGMVNVFVDRLGTMADDAGGLHDRMAAYSGRIEKTDNLSSLSELVAEVMRDTRGAESDMRRSRDDLLTAKQEVDQCQTRIVQLQEEIVSISDRLHEDQLTSLLNRRGLARAFEVEAARAERHNQDFCLAILDIDNFKSLNDSLGHRAGDLALMHLADVFAQSIRPSDIISRYGGEEFVILLPETTLEGAISVMNRVQRQLTRRFFLNHNERVLITFSAGVAQRLKGESQDDLVGRADRALYRAKEAGKNRVVSA